MPKQKAVPPDHIHNPSCPCSCEIEFSGKAASIKYCSLHAAAPDMLNACIAALSQLTEDREEYLKSDIKQLRDAIRKGVRP